MHNQTDPNNLDSIYALMFDAIEGTLTTAQEEELASYLTEHPEFAQEMSEYGGMEDIFSTVELGMVEPPATFVEDTLAFLPNLKLRRLLSAFSVAILIVSGLLPIFLFINIINSASYELFEAFVTGMVQFMLDAGFTLAAQPLSLVVVGMMLGSILLWSAIYRRMVLQPALLNR